MDIESWTFSVERLLSMKAVRLMQLGKPLQDAEVAIPALGPSDLLVRVAACGICHSDAHYRAGISSIDSLPVTPGHEVAGRVEAVGEEVTHAPIYGWLLLVSGWARRATFLCAVLPLFAISIFEKITFNTAHFASMIGHRLTGFAAQAFDFQGQSNPDIHSLAQLTPGRYLMSPDLWLGLAVAAAFIFAAVRLRRYRGPL